MACGGFFGPSTAILARWFRKRRGLALGLFSAGASVGGTVIPIAVRSLIPRIGWAYRWCQESICLQLPIGCQFSMDHTSNRFNSLLRLVISQFGMPIDYPYFTLHIEYRLSRLWSLVCLPQNRPAALLACPFSSVQSLLHIVSLHLWYTRASIPVRGLHHLKKSVVRLD